MESFFEILFDILFELIIEGSLEVSMTKSIKVPLLLRILAVLFIVVIYGGLCAVFLIVGIKNEQPLLIGISVVLLIMVIVAFVIKYRGYRRR
ncbi:MAG: hypothetical protein HFJ03_13780 [Lachnospira sp.]|nr:hypothetical protein [Lachnospira sp.]